jgi:hypothetical protein
VAINPGRSGFDGTKSGASKRRVLAGGNAVLTYQIFGRVIDKIDRSGISGLRVEAWDRDFIFDDVVGNAIIRW